ncbi:MAG: hypothetical protein AAF378_12285 [Cyanobacteria bacterium P01_A01_bin.84]
MKRNLIKDLFDPSKNLPLFLLIGYVGLPIFSTVINDFVLKNFGSWVQSKWGINETIFRVILTVVILSPLLIIFSIAKISELIGSFSRPAINKPQDLKETFPGLILLASAFGINSPAHVALKHHWNNGIGNLNYCWIICGGSVSLKAARELLHDEFGINVNNQRKFEYDIYTPGNKNRKLKVILENLSPPNNDDPQRVLLLINKIFRDAYKKYNLNESEIIADYTGGTKSMTSGVILACANPQRRLQFMKPGGYVDGGRADLTKKSIATEVQVAFKLKPVKTNK